MRRFGIIGHPVSSSLSPQLMRRLGIHYTAFDVAPGKVPEFLSGPGSDLAGFNATHPHKSDVMALMHELSSDAVAVGAVNCAVKVGSRWVGHNTDHLGVEHVLRKHGASGSAALILGTGGAARAGAHALSRQGWRWVMVSRRPGRGQLSWEELSRVQPGRFQLLVNATPLDLPEIPLERFGRECFVFDMNYKPGRTTGLVQRAQQMGLRAVDGLDMLLGQHGWNLRIWLGGDAFAWMDRLYSAASELVP